MRIRIPLTAILLTLLVPAVACAGTWRTVKLPRRTALSGVTCLETNWCEAVGGWRNKLEVGHWNGRRWSISTRLPDPKGAALFAITCRSTRSCVAVGQLFPRQYRPVNPLIERWNGRRWRVESAPKPHAPKGYRGVNTRLFAVACPGAKLCFAVGQAVPFGAGNAPGSALIERWDGRRWHLMSGARGSTSELDSVSCTSTRACTAVGGFEYTTGRPDETQNANYATTIERWNGSKWSLGSVSGFDAGEIGGVLGVACTSSSSCLAVGNQENTTSYADQAIAAPGDGTTFTAAPLAFPPSAYRGGSAGNPVTKLGAVACAPTDPDFCAAVGNYGATNGAQGPLGAIWNGSSWSQVALRRGPVELESVSCPALGWCMAVGSDIAEAWR